MPHDTGLGDAIAAARPGVVAALAARFRDLGLAEDGFADACEIALVHFADHPRPASLAGWLHVAAKRRIIDRMRRSARYAKVLADLPDDGSPSDIPDVEPIPDERLRLIFICCHPAIAPDARAALTLRIVCGVPTAAIAAAFLMAEPAMYQRLTRAKAKIAAAGVPFETPPPHLWPDRLAAVLATLEIGYALAYQDAASSETTATLAPEALRLSAMLAELLPGDPEILGLAAMVQLAESRRAARVDANGAMVPLSQQDALLWDNRLIASATRLMARAAAIGRSGPYQLMAAIHLTHARRNAEGATDWQAIVSLYDVLMAVRPSRVVAINRAIALAQVHGPLAALQVLDGLDAATLANYRPWHAARARLLADAGDRAAATQAYVQALALNPPRAEALYLASALAALETSA